MSAEFVIETESYRFFTPSILIPIFGAPLILGLVHLWEINRRNYKMVSNIPGPRAYPIIGNAHLALFKNPHGKTMCFDCS